jgi:hypothetical protein
MIYDGKMTKHVGNSPEPLVWEGSLGVLSGSTPTVYQHFEEEADMGERFIYYRMKDYDEEKATHLALSRKEFGKELDQKLSTVYQQYIKEIVTFVGEKEYTITDEVNKRITKVSIFAERIRTTVKTDRYTNKVTHIPVPAFPMRVALQLTSIAKGLMAIKEYETGSPELGEEELGTLDWCAYSLANEEKRACLKLFASIDFEHYLNTQTVADKIGLPTEITGNILQNLASTRVLRREGDNNNLKWHMNNREDWEILRRIQNIKDVVEIENREAVLEDNISDSDEPEEIGGGFKF